MKRPEASKEWLTVLNLKLLLIKSYMSQRQGWEQRTQLQPVA